MLSLFINGFVPIITLAFAFAFASALPLPIKYLIDFDYAEIFILIERLERCDKSTLRVEMCDLFSFEGCR
jgi:hypothetical protein